MSPPVPATEGRATDRIARSGPAASTATRPGHPTPASPEQVGVRTGRRWSLRLTAAAVVVVAALAVAGLVSTVDGPALADAARRAAGDPGGLAVAVGGFGAAFVLRSWAWSRTLPGLSFGHSLAALHVALAGNHVLPLRLGEPLRVVSAVRRTGVPVAAATSSTVALRTADIASLLLIGLVAGPATVSRLLGPWGAVAAAAVAAIGAGAVLTMARQRRAGLVRLPGPMVLAMVFAAWACEGVVVWQVARWFDLDLGATGAMLVLSAAVSAQLVAVAPGGLGTYEAAGAVALASLGVPFGTGLTVALGLHGFKTLYSLVTGAVAVVAPEPGLAGRLRVPARPPWRRPAPAPPGPVVLFLPALDEGPRVAEVVARAPRTVRGRPVEVIVVDDGSRDDTAAQAEAAGAVVVRHDHNRGLGAAVRTGFAEGVRRGAAAIAFCDADGEYDPARLEDLVGPILDGQADYVVGSRFAGRIDHMRPHRRFGNQVLTRWVRFASRRPVTDGQSGYRALSRSAATEVAIAHDYNYAQVLTLDLALLGFGYAEVPIRYRFRSSGRSFVRLGPYLRRVVPTVWRQLNPIPNLDH